MTSQMTSTPPELTTAQKEALRRFAKMRVGAAFMEQGMGKSRVAVELANLRSERIDAVLWVTPFSVKGAAAAEAEKWGLRVPVRFVGYETLSQSDATYLELRDWVKSRRVMVVADESSFIKNKWSTRSERMLALRKLCPYALALNGTPLTRDLWDVKTQMDWLDPRIIGCTPRQYRSRYFVKHEMGAEGSPEYRCWFTAYWDNIGHLRSLMAPYVIEAKLDFDKGESNFQHFAVMSESSWERYVARKQQFVEDCGGDFGADELEVYKLLGDLARIVALDSARHEEIAKNIAGRCLVFCQFLDELDGIAQHIGPHLRITGQTPEAERERVLAEFRSGDRPLLMTYGTGSFGLNLQDASVMHLASESFDYGRTTQAQSRIRRLGQTEDITYHQYTSGTGIEDLIGQNLSLKEALAGIVRKQLTL